jgi:hypothetical protein
MSAVKQAIVVRFVFVCYFFLEGTGSDDFESCSME